MTKQRDDSMQFPGITNGSQPSMEIPVTLASLHCNMILVTSESTLHWVHESVMCLAKLFQRHITASIRKFNYRWL